MLLQYIHVDVEKYNLSGYTGILRDEKTSGVVYICKVQYYTGGPIQYECQYSEMQATNTLLPMLPFLLHPSV